MAVTMNRIDAEGQRVRDEWTRTASVVAEPMRVVGFYTLREERSPASRPHAHASVGLCAPRSVCKQGKRAE
jgi:hypothetical protein